MIQILYMKTVYLLELIYRTIFSLLDIEFTTHGEISAIRSIFGFFSQEYRDQ